MTDLSVTGSVSSRATGGTDSGYCSPMTEGRIASRLPLPRHLDVRLSGRITNRATGGPIAGARVTVTFGGASGRDTTSDSTGAYLVRRIPVGPVSFTVGAPGFTTVTRTATMDGNVAVDVAL